MVDEAKGVISVQELRSLSVGETIFASNTCASVEVEVTIII